MFILRKWSVTGIVNPSKHPVQKGALVNRLVGKIFNNPKFENGKNVITSNISKIDGRKITTSSGSVYVLFGPPDDSFLDFINSYNIKFNEENPISFDMIEK